MQGIREGHGRRKGEQKGMEERGRGSGGGWGGGGEIQVGSWRNTNWGRGEMQGIREGQGR